MISVVIVHKGNQKYFDNNVRITSANNKVYILGDSTNKYIEKYRNVTHIDIDTLPVSADMIQFIKCFKNYSTNNHNFELICFLRVFWMHAFSKKYNITSMFHLDSDCILPYDINKYPFKKDIAYSLCCANSGEFAMAASIHNALLNVEFFERFTKLCTDIYVTKDKLNMIIPKILYHKKNNIPGGICDMTLYSILAKEMDVQDLQEPVNDIVFINNINNGEGHQGLAQYEMEGKHMKIYEDNKVHDIINDKFYTTYTIHFSGTAKRMLENL